MKWIWGAISVVVVELGVAAVLTQNVWLGVTAGALFLLQIGFALGAIYTFEIYRRRDFERTCDQLAVAIANFDQWEAELRDQ